MSIDQQVATRVAPRRRRAALLFWSALAMFLFARLFVFHLYLIPSGSMKSTLLVGDYVLVSKISYGLSRHNVPFAPSLLTGRLFASEPERGDVVVFRPPHAPRTDFIKRVVGIPGDRVQIRDGRLYINGTVVPRQSLGTFETVDCDRSLERCHPVRFQRFEETLPGGRRHEALATSERGRGDRTVEFVVTPGHYFMLGDNRNASEDSRFWECEEADGRRVACPLVPAANLVGKAHWILFSRDESWRLWSPSTWGAHTRWTRLLARIP